MTQPTWVTRINYLGHAVGGAQHLISLQPDELIDTAKVTTGLSDFGDDDWQTQYYRHLAQLNDIEQWDILVRLLIKTKIISALRQRLLVIDTFKQHPDIGNEPIVKPLIITGMARTGTSILFELLSQDEQFRSPLGYEAISPVTPPANTLSGGIGREEIAQSMLDLMMDIQPASKIAHEASYVLPAESAGLLEAVAVYAGSLGQEAPAYQAWSQRLNDFNYHRWHKKLLQLLQYHQVRKTWLLKDPSNIHCLPAILEQYPDARIIHTHRDPLKALPSLLSLGKNSIGIGPDGSSLLRMQLYGEQQRFGLEKVIEQRRHGLIPDAQIADIHFHDLLHDPVTTIQSAYRKLGYAFTQALSEKIVQYLHHKPRHHQGEHQYSLQTFGLNKETLQAQYQFYTDYYAIASEA